MHLNATTSILLPNSKQLNKYLLLADIAQVMHDHVVIALLPFQVVYFIHITSILEQERWVVKIGSTPTSMVITEKQSIHRQNITGSGRYFINLSSLYCIDAR